MHHDTVASIPKLSIVPSAEATFGSAKSSARTCSSGRGWTGGSMADLTAQQGNLLREMVLARVSKLKLSSGYEYIGCCPAHDDVNPSWGINMRTGLHNCHSCSFGGNAVILAKHWSLNPKPFYSADYQNGLSGLAEKVRVVVEPPVKSGEEQEKPPLNLPSYDKIEDWDLVPLPEEKVRKNWNLDALNELQVHWSQKYRGLAFLVLDSDYEFIGCYLHKPEIGNTRFTVGVRSQIYPQFLLKDYSPKRPLILCEGLVDVIAVMSKGMQGVSFTAGANSTPKDLSGLEPWSHPAIAELNESTVWSASNPLIIAYDNDKAGWSGMRKQAQALKKQFPEMTVYGCNWKKLKTKYPAGADITDIKHDDFIRLLETATESTLTQIGEFKILTAKQALAKEPEPIEYIIEGLLPHQSNTLFAGETGSGKSYFALQMSLAIANNEKEFLGFKILKKDQRVLYVDTECGVNLLHNRFRQVIRNFKPFTGESRFFMMSKVGRQSQVWETINMGIEAFKPDILIIDCLYNTSSNVRMDMAHSLSTLTDKMTDLREQYEITIMAIHHFIKGNHQDGLIISRIQGASPLLYWAEHITGIINTQADPSIRLFRVMKSRKGHDSSHYFKLVWDADQHRFINEGVLTRYLHYLVDDNKMKEWVKFLADLRDVADKDERFETKDALNIGENPPLSKATPTIHRWLKQLKHNGFIESLGHGIWKLTDLQVIDELPDDEI
jgi:hypothetical protein